jgi:hypothetical protein
MIKQVSAAALAALAISLAPLASAQAAAPAASRPLPNPCRTFTAKSADALFGLGRHARLSEKLTRTRTPAARTCTVRHARQKLVVVTQRQAGGFGMGFNCYKRPKLGSYGQICVSAVKKVHFSFVVFRKHGGYGSDGINATLPNKGRRLYRFALAQYRTFRA